MSTEVLLRHQHRSVHDVPRDRADQDAVLRRVVASALAAQGPDGSLELDPGREDVGDTSLGVTSLLLLALRRGVLPAPGRDGAGEPGAGEPVPTAGPTSPGVDADGVPGPERTRDAAVRSVGFFLAERVFRRDNPGYPFYRRRNSGLPYARYVIADGAHPFGDWPSTVWALLNAVNVIRLGPGILPDPQLDELVAVAEGYWTWLTEVTFFNSQDTANQALGAVVGALLLADELAARDRPDDAARLRADALDRYEALRAQWVPELGVPMPREHGGGWDGNYGPITLSFLAQAHRVTGDPRFTQAGDALARYLDARLSATGFDLGGPRYSEQHAGFEGVLGLRYFGRRTGTDLGRFRGDDRFRYLMDADGSGDGSSAPDGHFAFMTVWTFEDDTPWTPGPIDRNRRHDLRRGTVSVTFREDLAPRLVDVAGTTVLPAVVAGQPGLGPLHRDRHRSHLLTRPLGPVRSCELSTDTVSAKLVHTAVATRAEVLLTTQTLWVTDGTGLHLVVVLDAAALPPDAEPALLAGLPYATPAARGHRSAKIVELTGPDGVRHPFGTPGSTVTDGPLIAGRLRIRGNGPLRAVSPVPPPGAEDLVFSTAATLSLGQEQAAFAAAPDPRGYGNPDAAWARFLATDAVEVTRGVRLDVPGPDRSRDGSGTDPGGTPALGAPVAGDGAGDTDGVGAPTGPGRIGFAVSWLPADRPDPGPLRLSAGPGGGVLVDGGALAGGQVRVLIGALPGDDRGEPVLRLLPGSGDLDG